MNLKQAHAHSAIHREEILNSEFCGCFYCLAIFLPPKIVEWVDCTDDSDEGQTALCPYCGIDSVIGSSSGVPITKDFLSRMNKFWF